ncbi:MAG: hypothetical protein ACRED0_06015 [Gammaproteobacteria bacterium]
MGEREHRTLQRPVEGALNRLRAALQHVGVDSLWSHVLGAEEFLDGSDIIVCLQPVGGKGMAERMTGPRLGKPCGRTASFTTGCKTEGSMFLVRFAIADHRIPLQCISRDLRNAFG